MKYIVVCGGVVSGLGKGVTISSIGRLLQGCGLRVTSIKIDPYVNVDAGTMSPFEHGEVFVLNDGGECDLDLGNYERFLNIELTSDHNITTGKIYREVISHERRGDYLGKTVQVVPHLTDLIQKWIERVSRIPVDGSGLEADICLIEVGGTVGDIESMVFLEALRQFQQTLGPENFCLMFVSLVPVLGGEQKTKPTQHGVKELRSLGLSPKIIFCRSSFQLNLSTKNKVSGFCHVPLESVLSVHDVNNIYHVPLMLMEQNLHLILEKELQIKMNAPQMNQWASMAKLVDNLNQKVQIVVVGKYTGSQDSYLSVIKALKHASLECERELDLVWVEATQLEDTNNIEAWDILQKADGVIVPGGFGDRGFLGKVKAAEFCRLHKKPFLGVCLGFQAMVVEFCRNVLHIEDANSEEFDSNATKVIVFMPEVDKKNMGGTMRLGARETFFVKKSKTSLAQLLYGSSIISERHRHRYEVNPQFITKIHNAGLHFVAKDSTGQRMEVVELSNEVHPFYLGCQYHPEFKSRPLASSPPFKGLILAASGMLEDFLRTKINSVEKNKSISSI